MWFFSSAVSARQRGAGAHLLLVVMGLLAVGVPAAIMFEPASLRFRFMAP